MQSTESMELISELKDEGITLEKLASQFGVSYATVYRWSTGKAEPRMAEMKLLKQLLSKTKGM